jgi:hypothetical protein
MSSLPPPIELSQVSVVKAKAQVATLNPPNVRLEVFGKIFPHTNRLDRQRDEVRVPDLLVDPAPVAGRLLVPNRPLINQCDRHTPKRQIVGDGAPDDPATDDYNVCRTIKR